jgi:hypothetical protein
LLVALFQSGKAQRTIAPASGNMAVKLVFYCLVVNERRTKHSEKWGHEKWREKLGQVQFSVKDPELNNLLYTFEPALRTKCPLIAY